MILIRDYVLISFKQALREEIIKILNEATSRIERTEKEVEQNLNTKLDDTTTLIKQVHITNIQCLTA